ncbi:hypothetical protein HPB47_016988 [Ixodes persulcatus]|uniref:Uncharacterized protein n=1 Tax=Ixodes persulcatus TaxID=34615 RepID=A0AC60QT62_IXOPE|nr:hypothetical protein HPB47_016988 [Ixodes persulcatus]
MTGQRIKASAMQRQNDDSSKRAAYEESAASRGGANVEASMTLAKRYAVHAVLCQDGQVNKASSSCKAGQGGVCKHVAALLWHKLDLIREGRPYISDALACTEGARDTVWFRKLEYVKHDPSNKGKSARKTTEVRVDVAQATVKRLHTDFIEKGIFPIFADMMEEAEDEASAPRISLPVKECWNHQTPSSDPCTLTLTQAHHREEETRNQSRSMMWHAEHGLVWDEDIQEYGLVEVKTVSRAIDAHLTTFEEVTSRGFVEFIHVDKSVDKTHKHYNQVTGQLALTGLEWGDLAVD